MSQTSKLRESLERKLDQWEARGTAFENALAKSRSEMVAQVEHAKTALRSALTSLAARVDETRDLADGAGTELKRAFERLQVQLALGKAETRDAVAHQREQLTAAIDHAEDLLERNLHRLDGHALEARLRLLEAADLAQAHLEVAELYMQGEARSAKLGLEKEVAALRAKLSRFNSELAQKRRGAAVEVSRWEREMSDALSRIRAKFRDS